MRNVILQKNNKKDYTLIQKVKDNNQIFEYVVAYGYNPITDSWLQGHYYFKYEDALKHFNR